jgi:hypothetical protein
MPHRDSETKILVPQESPSTYLKKRHRQYDAYMCHTSQYAVAL